MSISSITSAAATAREPVLGPSIGQLELLDASGAVEQLWDVALGRWTLGSDPQSTFCIPDPGSIEPLHLVFNVGEKYTLIKAQGALKVGGRVVRQSLMDKTTAFECGERKFTLYLHERSTASPPPQDRSASLISNLSTVAHEEAMETVRESQVMPLELPKPLASSLKGELDELRGSIESLQQRIASIPDPESWDQRIEEYTNRSVLAMEEELGQRIREPLRDELTEMLQSQGQTLESAIEKRVDSLELRLRQLAEQWAIEVQSTQREIANFHQQIADLFEAQESYRGMNPRASGDRQAFDDRYAGDEPIGSDAYHAESIPQDFERIDEEPWSEPEPEEQHLPIREEAKEPASDDEIEFDVDAESISLRLSRMLGEHVDRHPSSPPSGPREDAPSYVSETDDIQNDIQNDIRADSPSDSLEDPDAIRLPTEFDEDSDIEGAADGDESDAIEIPASEWRKHLEEEIAAETKLDSATSPKISRTESESESEEGSEEESIEDYMQRLLQRVRTGPGANEAPAAPKSQAPKTSVQPQENVRKSTVTAVNPAPAVRKPPRDPVANKTVTSDASSETKTDLNALRELANSNARRAINRSVARRKGTDVFGKAMVSVIAILSGNALFFISNGPQAIRFGAVTVCGIIALVWGIGAFREISTLVKQQAAPESDS